MRPAAGACIRPVAGSGPGHLFATSDLYSDAAGFDDTGTSALNEYVADLPGIRPHHIGRVGKYYICCY